jgi:hypothetical protein
MKINNLFLTLFLIGIVLHLGSTASHASFLIGFTNGRTISVENYRIEGDQIFFYFGSGVLKFSRSEVKSILEERDEIKEEKREERSQAEKVAAKTPEKNVLTKAPVKKNEGIEQDRMKKAELSGRLEVAKKNYFEASDKSDKEEARKIMVSISKELFTLEEEVMEKNNGVLPDWWK